MSQKECSFAVKTFQNKENHVQKNTPPSGTAHEHAAQQYTRGIARPQPFRKTCPPGGNGLCQASVSSLQPSARRRRIAVPHATPAPRSMCHSLPAAPPAAATRHARGLSGVVGTGRMAVQAIMKNTFLAIRRTTKINGKAAGSPYIS